MMQESSPSCSIHHVQYGPNKCQTGAPEGEVKGCQERYLPYELNKCFMNFKQQAVCWPAILRDHRFTRRGSVGAERGGVEKSLIKRILHIFACIWQYVNLPLFLRSAFTVYCMLVLFLSNRPL